MIKILITGADGFVGSALCHRLSTGKKYSIRAAIRSTQKIMNLPDNIEFFVIGNIGPDTQWKAALDNIDVVIHLAGLAHATDNIEPGEYYKVNARGTCHLAKVAAESGVRRLIYLSSIKVNGEYTKKNLQGETLPFSESDPPQPQDDYAISKWQAEQALNEISAESEMETVILRPPLIYGYQVKANFLSLLKLIDSSIPLPFAKLKNKRSFIYLGNLIDIILKCIADPKVANQTFLVSDGEDISVEELIKKIANALGRRPLLLPLPDIFLKFLGKIAGKYPEIEKLIQPLSIDNKKIVETVGWKPPFTLDQGLKLTVDSYKSK